MKSKLLILIVLVAAILRLYKLESYPVSLSWDEIAIGYNAYSIATTGSDEYGTKRPLLFKSFNDYKLPGYIYLDSIFVKYFGLSELSVRLPSAILGTIAVLFLYFFTKELFNNFQIRFRGQRLDLPLITTGIMAVSPWHLQFSRAAFEANAALTLILGGMTLLLYGLKNKLAALVSLPILATSIYFYYSPRIFIPMMLLVFLLIFKKEINKNLKYYLYGFVLSTLILFPITIQFFSPQGFKRVREVSVFEERSLVVDYVDARAKNRNIVSSIFLNRRIPIVFETLHNYFSHFSPGFLFFGDDPNPRHRPAFHGNLYIFEIPLILLGIWILLKNKNQKAKYFLLAWLFLAPLPAAFAKESPHSLRSLLMLPSLVILSSLGVTAIFKRRYLAVALAVIAIFFFISYLYSYFIIYPLRDSLSWAYGYKQMFMEVSRVGDNYDRVIVTGHYWKPYIFYLFYNSIDPKIYQLVQNQQTIGKFRFGTTGWDMGGQDLNQEEADKLKGHKTLLVVTPAELETFDDKDNFKKISAINDYSGKTEIFLIGQWR